MKEYPFISERYMAVINLLIESDWTLTNISRSLKISKPMALRIMNDMRKDRLVFRYKRGTENVYKLRTFTFLISVEPKKSLIVKAMNKPFKETFASLGRVAER